MPSQYMPRETANMAVAAMPRASLLMHVRGGFLPTLTGVAAVAKGLGLISLLSELVICLVLCLYGLRSVRRGRCRGGVWRGWMTA